MKPLLRKLRDKIDSQLFMILENPKRQARPKSTNEKFVLKYSVNGSFQYMHWFSNLLQSLNFESQKALVKIEWTMSVSSEKEFLSPTAIEVDLLCAGTNCLKEQLIASQWLELVSACQSIAVPSK